MIKPEITLDEIKKKISEYSKDQLIGTSYNFLNSRAANYPIWSVFTLMKLAYLYANNTAPYKELSHREYEGLVNEIFNFNQDHIGDFINAGSIDKAFQALHAQQFYLLKEVYLDIFAIQLKLYITLAGKYKPDEVFQEKTGLSILDFIICLKIVWIYTDLYNLGLSKFPFNGLLNDNLLGFLQHKVGLEKAGKFFRLLTVDIVNPKNSIESYKRGIDREDLQTLEATFFVMFPFQVFDGKLHLIHTHVFNHTINYYIYDYLKANVGSKFTEEFGFIVERYIECGIREIGYKYNTEKQIEKLLPPLSKLVDFHFPDDNVFMECKAIELQPFVSVNPTDERLYNSLKDSLLKAYFQQLVPTAKKISPDKENWGIIITYKELFWSRFTELYDVTKDKYLDSEDNNHLKPENVFIIDVCTWDVMMQVIKDKKASLLDILRIARKNNSIPETSKQSFRMHLKIYGVQTMKLSYLTKEHKMLVD
ncbi:MAG TPA: hypothetical protein VK154_14600 [Chitinophagales bacterium]|nr:hypothetical protein [Chitinophagales bacterium]